MHQPDVPPELLNGDGFAWSVWHDRTPKLIGRVRDAHPYGPQQRAALDALLAEVTGGVMQPPASHAGDRQGWLSWDEGYFGRPWAQAPFLWSESLFYRRLLDAVGYFEPGPWQHADPFEFLKSAELADPALAGSLAALDDPGHAESAARQGRDRLIAALWGNQADLGFRMGATARDGDRAEERIICDQSAELLAALGPEARVIVVADNAGPELLADLILTDHLLTAGLAASVALHLKPWPYYVSDATTADADACLRRLTAAPGAAGQIGRRLHAAIAGGAVTLCTDDFYCASWPYDRAPAHLAGLFAQATLTIVKGDLNYRRLVGDRAWSPDTPFAAVTAYFPGTVAAVRTLKSEVVTGLSPEVTAALDATGEPWRTDGRHGLIQVRRA